MKALTRMIANANLYLFSMFMILYGCAQSETGMHHENPRYEATTPFRKDISIEKEYVCQIHGIKHIEVRAMEKGYLQNIYVDEGQVVHRGQPMYKIMPAIYQAELMKAQAEANIMNIEYKNTKGLADQNIVSKNELALAKAKLDKANAEVKLAETHLGFTDIYAPFDGIVDHLLVRNGSLLDEGTLLTTLSDISKLWVYFNVPESEYLDYKTKKNDDQTYSRVRLKMANGAIFDQQGTIETIEADFDNTAGNIEFRAAFPNPNGLLRHGETGTIIMRKPYKNALLIPQKATFEILDKMFVYVIGNDGALEQRLITTEAEIPYFFLVKEGIKDDEKILIEGLRKVHPGDHVEVSMIPAEKLQSSLRLHAE